MQHLLPHPPSIALATVLSLLPASTSKHEDACSKTTNQAYTACRKEALAEYWLRRGTCTNIADEHDRLACIHDAFSELQDAKDLCGEQRSARSDICERLGGGPYDPEIDPANFLQGVDNRWMPLVPGQVLVYERRGGNLRDVERTVVTVLPEIEPILGVACTTVHDVVTVGGALQEDTLDWFAEDRDGNVWYFGEASLSFDGHVASTEGSWRAGIDGAKPGIVMRAAPRGGDFYRQEFLLGTAEDVAGVLTLSDPVTVPAGSFPDCLLTEEFNALEPGSIEHKDFAPGVGLVLTIEDDGTRSELVEIR